MPADSLILLKALLPTRTLTRRDGVVQTYHVAPPSASAPQRPAITVTEHPAQPWDTAQTTPDHQAAYAAAHAWAAQSDPHRQLLRDEGSAIGEPSLHHHLARDERGAVVGLIAHGTGRRGTYIHALATDPAHSGRGVATELLRQAHEAGKQAGSDGGLSLKTYPWSVGYYEKLGFKREADGLHHLSAADARALFGQQDTLLKALCRAQGTLGQLWRQMA